MPQAVVVHRNAPFVRTLLIALLGTVLIIGAVAFVVWAWPDADNDAVLQQDTTWGFGSYTPGDPPVMGDRHFTAAFTTAGYGPYPPGSPPTVRDPG